MVASAQSSTTFLSWFARWAAKNYLVYVGAALVSGLAFLVFATGYYLLASPAPHQHGISTPSVEASPVRSREQSPSKETHSAETPVAKLTPSEVVGSSVVTKSGVPVGRVKAAKVDKAGNISRLVVVPMYGSAQAQDYPANKTAGFVLEAMDAKAKRSRGGTLTVIMGDPVNDPLAIDSEEPLR